MTGSFRAEQIGSLIRPDALLDARDAYREGRIDLAALRRAEDEAIATALQMQKQAGLDVFSDGEMRRDAWQTNFSEAVHGFEDEYPMRETKAPDGSIVQVEVHSKAVVSRLQQHRRIVDVDASYMTQHAPGPFKITMPSPALTARAGYRPGRTADYETYDALAADVAAIVRDEMLALVESGVTYIQLDEGFTNFHTQAGVEAIRAQGLDPEVILARQIELENSCYDAVRREGVTLASHVCRGSRTSAPKSLSTPERDSREWDWLCERLFGALHVNRFLFEWDNSFEVLRHLPAGKTFVLGIVTSLDGSLESQDDLLRCIEAASKYCPVDRLALSSQCGYQGSGTRDGSHMTIEQQQRKLELVAETARKVWG